MANSNEYMRTYLNRRYHERRAEWIEKLGGACIDCGATENLEFDHVDKNLKSFNIAKMLLRRAEVIDPEMQKCALRCEPCHAKKTSQEAMVHGGGLSGKKNCKCDPCKARKAEYSKDYYQRNKEHIEAVKKSRRVNTRVVEHGGGATGKKGCFCDLCKVRKSEYNKANRHHWNRKSRAKPHS
jgi:hypothetical protein